MGYLQSPSGSLASGVLTGLQTVVEVLTGVVLMLLLTVILLADGNRMWTWLVTRVPERRQRKTKQAARSAWRRLCHTEGRREAAGAAGLVSLVTGVGRLPCPSAGHGGNGLSSRTKADAGFVGVGRVSARARGRIPTAGG